MNNPLSQSRAAPQSLAIVIPAHRTLYLAHALDSLAAQTDPDFTVYVGDDASTDDIAGVCRAFRGRLDLNYHRFNSNLGRGDLVGQWARCIALGAEPWVWMIGDDDELEPGCVGAWRAALQAYPAAPLFHFAVRRIDAQGAVVATEPEYPPQLSARAFLRARLRFQLQSYAPDYVFARAAYDRVGGFARFPLAWCSDDATWVRLAAAQGIRSVSGPRVRWRLSGSNISSRSDANAAAKALAHLQFVEWLAAELPRLPCGPGDPGDEELGQLAVWWHFVQAGHVGHRFGAATAWNTSRRLARTGFCGLPAALLRAVRSDWQRRRLLRTAADR